MTHHNLFKKSVALIIGTALLNGCASLTKSQLNEVNTFGQLTSNFSAYPSKFILSFNTINEKEALLRANSRIDPDTHFTEIDSAYQHKKENDTLTGKSDLTFKIIDKYAQALVLLTADKHTKQLDTAAKSFGTNIDGLITNYNKIDSKDQLPTGIGGAVAELITLGGEQFIRSRQAKETKDFVTKADPMIIRLTNNVIAQLGNGAKDKNGQPVTFSDLVNQLRQDIKTDYKAFLGKRTTDIVIKKNKDNADYSASFINYRYATLDDDRECLQLLSDLDALQRLLNDTKTATANLAKAHHKLLTDIDTKKSLVEFATELQTYGDNIKDLKTAIQKIK
ncbi:hypothetical protein ACPPVU_12585 [Mucilaginibacter sp. McL0603]|uniref:hypothetical protein n=1 Tax=Mucilaginibacter sp. McL0603 TaxID=3415670 RepID=UPI003CF4A926